VVLTLIDSSFNVVQELFSNELPTGVIQGSEYRTFPHHFAHLRGQGLVFSATNGALYLEDHQVIYKGSLGGGGVDKSSVA